MNLCPFKLNRVSVFGTAQFVKCRRLKGFIHVQIEKGKFVVVCPRHASNLALGSFTS